MIRATGIVGIRGPLLEFIAATCGAPAISYIWCLFRSGRHDQRLFSDSERQAHPVLCFWIRLNRFDSQFCFFSEYRSPAKLWWQIFRGH